MDEGYVRPEQFLFGAVTSVIIGLLMAASRRPSETQGRYLMEVKEIVGYSEEEFGNALALMEDSMNLGQKARISLCTEALPTEEELAEIYLGMVGTGCHLSYPTAMLIEGIPTTKFVLEKGSPQWQIIIPILIPLFTIGLIAWGIAKLPDISKALMPLILVSFSGLIILAVVLRRPVEKYIERGGKIPLLPSTSKKALAVR